MPKAVAGNAPGVRCPGCWLGAQSAQAAGMSVVKVGTVPRTTDGQVLGDPVLQVSTLSDPRLAPLLLGSFGRDKPTSRPQDKTPR